MTGERWIKDVFSISDPATKMQNYDAVLDYLDGRSDRKVEHSLEIIVRYL